MEGYIKLHRKLLENPIAQKAHYGWLWVVLLLKANYKDREVMWNGGLVTLKAGQFITGRNKLSEEIGVPASTIEDALRWLETQHQIRQQKNNKFRIITIVNWDKYQINDEDSDSKSDIYPTTSRHLADTDKKDKKDKKDNNTILATSVAGNEVNRIIELFKEVNPSYERLFANKTQRSAVERLIEKIGFEKLSSGIKVLKDTNVQKYAPIITTPLQFEEKMGSLITFLNKQKNNSKIGIL